MIRFFILLLASSQLVFGEELPCPANANLVEPTIQQTAMALTNTCSFFDIHMRRLNIPKGSALYSQREKELKKSRASVNRFAFKTASPEEVCKCLDDSKINNLIVPDEMKVSFKNQKLKTKIGKVFLSGLRDINTNVTRFKNLKLPKDLHDKSMSLCNMSGLKTIIDRLQQKTGTADCKSGGADFAEKLKDVFGDDNLDEMPGQYHDEITKVEAPNCISKQMYQHLRSANTSSQFALGFFKSKPAGSNFVTNGFEGFLENNTSVKDLLSYDLLFSLGYQDPEFRSKVEAKMNSFSDQRLLETVVYDKIHSDPEILNAAFDSLESSCKKFNDNLTTFLCAPETPNLDAPVMSMLAEDVLKNESSDPEHRQQMIDYFTGQYSCNPQVNLEGSEKQFSEYVKSVGSFERMDADPVSNSPQSDYSKFNAAFCSKRSGVAITPNELPRIMKDYFESLKMDKGINLNAVFASPEIRNNLNLRIDVTKDPMISLPQDMLSSGKLPEISQIAWDGVRSKLIEKGLTGVQADQLYSILEMQINIRSREVIELREDLANKYPNVHMLLSPADVDGLLRGDLLVQKKLRFMNNPDVATVTGDISELYAAQQTSRTERFNSVPNSQVETPTYIPGQSQVDPVSDRQTDAKPDVPATSTENKQASTTETKKVSGLIVSQSSSSGSGSGSGTSLNGSGQTQSSGLTLSSSLSSTSKTSGQTSGGTNDQSDSNSNSSSSSRQSTSVDNSYAQRMMDDVKRIEEEIARNRAKFNRLSNELNNAQSSANNSSRNSRTSTGKRSRYNYPRNVPFRTPEGDYYTPNAEGDELSSASTELKVGKETSKGTGNRSGGNGVGSSAPETKATVGSVNFGSASSGPDVGGRRIASVESDIRKQLNLAPFEYHRYIPHSIFDVVGSVEKVVLLLGLEGKSFKTIEAVEEIDPKTEKISIKYIERTFDFVPSGNFKSFKEAFSSKEGRVKTLETHFSYKRNKENLKLSKKYALATREVFKEEVSHSHVLDIQNFVLSDSEIRDMMYVNMELLK